MRRWVAEGRVLSRVGKGSNNKPIIEVQETGQALPSRQTPPLQIMKDGYTFIPAARWAHNNGIPLLSTVGNWCRTGLLRYMRVDTGAGKHLYYVEENCPKPEWSARGGYKQQRALVGEAYKGMLRV